MSAPVTVAIAGRRSDARPGHRQAAFVTVGRAAERGRGLQHRIDDVPHLPDVVRVRAVVDEHLQVDTNSGGMARSQLVTSPNAAP
ncbi:hypothetical protein [Dactylosporangium sp. NPDC051541]|uniref:hypothetical protein n=1 Tax=Dactylosporangium sp. NPDC051541 TaxID=3363977 RepID=UPI0037A6E6E4